MGFVKNPMGFIKNPMGFFMNPMGFFMNNLGFFMNPMGFFINPMGFFINPMGFIVCRILNPLRFYCLYTDSIKSPRPTLYEYTETPGGSEYWEPLVEGIPIPEEGKFYNTLDEAIEMC